LFAILELQAYAPCLISYGAGHLLNRRDKKQVFAELHEAQNSFARLKANYTKFYNEHCPPGEKRPESLVKPQLAEKSRPLPSLPTPTAADKTVSQAIKRKELKKKIADLAPYIFLLGTLVGTAIFALFTYNAIANLKPPIQNPLKSPQKTGAVAPLNTDSPCH
jgi:hypothetical protein